MRFALIFCFTVCFSCQYFEKKKLNSDVILEQELQTFKWDEVDQYPTFETCDEDHNYEQNKVCFESIFTTHIFEALKDHDMVFLAIENDTILVDFLVSKTGIISILSLDASQLSETSTQNLNEILSASLLQLPKLYPAIKRSQHVQTVFQLPIILINN